MSTIPYKVIHEMESRVPLRRLGKRAVGKGQKWHSRMPLALLTTACVQNPAVD